MNKVHITLQGKGGVGKSFISSLIAQYLIARGDSVICVDTDPNNSTFSSIKALDAKFLELFDADNKFNERNFDLLIELIFENKDYNFVIDNGATSFLPLINYLSENHVFEMLSKQFEVVLHIPITGGQAQDDTINGFVHLLEKYKGVTFIIWLNEYHGKIVDSEGNTFENMDVYKKYKKEITAILKLPSQNEKTFGQDIEEMTKANLIFSQVDSDPRFNLMAKQRLKLFSQSVFSQMDLIL